MCYHNCKFWVKVLHIFHTIANDRSPCTKKPILRPTYTKDGIFQTPCTALWYFRDPYGIYKYGIFETTIYKKCRSFPFPFYNGISLISHNMAFSVYVSFKYTIFVYSMGPRKCHFAVHGGLKNDILCICGSKKWSYVSIMGLRNDDFLGDLKNVIFGERGSQKCNFLV